MDAKEDSFGITVGEITCSGKEFLLEKLLSLQKNDEIPNRSRTKLFTYFTIARKNSHYQTSFGTLAHINIFLSRDEYSQMLHQTINVMANCDVILFVISQISDGERVALYRYLRIISALAISHVIVLTHDADTKEKIKEALNTTNISYSFYTHFITDTHYTFIDIDKPDFIRILLQRIHEIGAELSPKKKSDPLKLSVTHVSHFFKTWGTIIGKVQSGSICVGDNIKMFPSGIRVQIKSISKHFENVQTAHSGDQVKIKLKSKKWSHLNVRQGDVMTFDDDPDGSEPIHIVRRLSAIVKIHESGMIPPKYVLSNSESRGKSYISFDKHEFQGWNHI